MSAGNATRILAVLVACVAAVGSATSSSNQPASVAGPDQGSPPPPQQMDASRALGLWRSTFGAVKIEADNSQGGLAAGNLQGIWIYQRQGQEVVGYFAGNLRGNVMQFRWQEPSNPPLTGEGYLVFDVQGRQYAGRWWNDKRDRVGPWSGWRQGSAQQTSADPGMYGQDDGNGQPPPSPYRRRPQYQPRPYQRQPAQPSPYAQPYQPPTQQPYQQQPYQQPYQQQPYQQPYQPQPPPTYRPQPNPPVQQPYEPQPYPPSQQPYEPQQPEPPPQKYY